MSVKKRFHPIVFLVAAVCVVALWATTMALPSASLLADTMAQADNPNPPANSVKLIFIHHSTGGNWLANIGEHELAGGLGTALMNNNYFVSATNYGWIAGGDHIGDRTDIGHWWEWFRGPNSATYMSALYAENDQNFGGFGEWSRLATDPGGENEIVMFKSCFPNSDLRGSPTDPVPPIGSNPLRAQDSGSAYHTVANARGIYIDLLEYFRTRQDKLFIVITAPPLQDATWASNARAFNTWLVNDWLDGYQYHNVAVFDFYNVLTDPDNHHRFYNGAIQYVTNMGGNTLYYPSGDDHPNATGNQKARDELVPLLNVYYNRWRSGAPPVSPSLTYLPLILRSYTPSSPPPPTEGLIQPADLVYQGAFRLPAGGVRPATFAYGGNAMTFNPSGDPSGPGDGFPGSLFVTGHDRLAYGELPDGSQVAEVSIPVPVNSDNLGNLNQAGFLQGFHNVAQGFFTGLDELPRIGMEYLNTSATGPKIHLAWGAHFDLEPTAATHAWFDPNLSAPDMRGTWFIGNQSFYSVNGYMFEIPASWADAHAAGRYLATGRYRDGGWSGMGPALFAYRPWIDHTGTPVPSGTHLAETVLLLYGNSATTDNIERCLNGYQHPDEWEGGAWITTNTGNSVVLFAGTKATGAKYWYGWVNPAGPQYPCVDEALVGQMTVCRLANGTPCPSGDLTECAGHNDYRGWWSARFDAQFILYDPADLAQVAAGATESWAPQPYASLDIDQYLFLNPAGVEPDMLGTGVQRRNRIGAVAYDRNNDLLYVLELFADEAQPVVHVWRVEG